MASVETAVAGGVSFALTDEQKELRALAREFATKEIRPKAAEYDVEMKHPVDVIAKAHEVGLMNLHVLCHYGRNSHHIVEAIFKATARALRQAVELDPRGVGVPSTKGVL